MGSQLRAISHPDFALGLIGAVTAPAARPLGRVPTGHIGDDIVWTMLGLALFGNAFVW